MGSLFWRPTDHGATLQLNAPGDCGRNGPELPCRVRSYLAQRLAQARRHLDSRSLGFVSQAAAGPAATDSCLLVGRPRRERSTPSDCYMPRSQRDLPELEALGARIVNTRLGKSGHSTIVRGEAVEGSLSVTAPEPRGSYPTSTADRGSCGHWRFGQNPIQDKGLRFLTVLLVHGRFRLSDGHHP